MANPWGGELEDFAVFHFVDSAAIHTRSLVETSKQHMARQRRRSAGGGAPSSSPNHSPLALIQTLTTGAPRRTARAPTPRGRRHS